jgi:Putative threonine/serine exporter
MESLNGRPCHHGHNCDVFLASYEKRCDRNGDLLNPSAMPPPSLDEVANLSLSVGKLFLETGASARTVHDVEEISRGFGCQKAEAYCQHAAIIVMLRRGAESCVQMGKVGEHGVNLRRAEALTRIVSHIALGEIDCPQAQREVDNVPRTAPGYPIWFVCLATGIACAAFGRLLHAAWLSFVPTLVARLSACSWGLHPDDSRQPGGQRLDEPLRAPKGESWRGASGGHSRRRESDARDVYPSRSRNSAGNSTPSVPSRAKAKQ